MAGPQSKLLAEPRGPEVDLWRGRGAAQARAARTPGGVAARDGAPGAPPPRGALLLCGRIPTTRRFSARSKRCSRASTSGPTCGGTARRSPIRASPVLPIHISFFAQAAIWLAERWGDRLSVDWREFKKADDLEPYLERFALFCETPGLDELTLSVREWIAHMKGPSETDAAFLVRRFRALRLDPRLHEMLYRRARPALHSRTGAGHAGEDPAEVRQGHGPLADRAVAARAAFARRRARASAGLRSRRDPRRGQASSSTSRAP